ncbi:hypothetical protein J4731_23170 [Providencia rettgeri]|nr:hypothetical protein [Providencia rettgeri]
MLLVTQNLVRQKHLSSVFNEYINQEMTQEDGKISTRGNIAGFKHKVGEALFGEVQIINTKVKHTKVCSKA